MGYRVASCPCFARSTSRAPTFPKRIGVPRPCKASSDQAAQSTTPGAKPQLLEKLRQTGEYPIFDLSGKIGGDIDELCRSAVSTGPGRIISLGQGTWQVFQIPHLSKIAVPLGIRLDIYYRLEGMNIYSNVKCDFGRFGTTWFCASGTVTTAKDSMDINFDKFWVDEGVGGLRPKLYDPETEADDGGSPMNSSDKFITAIGKLAFIPGFANFPVKYVDEDMTVFTFPVLSSTIAARKVA